MFNKNKGFCRSRACGMLLMLAGLVLMMIIVPGWAWAGVICGAMLIIGFLLWKYC